MMLFTGLFGFDRNSRCGDSGLVVRVVWCGHLSGESCVCKFVGHKVQLGKYVHTTGRYEIRGSWKNLGSPSDDYLICKDQTPRPLLLARMFSGNSLSEWDRFADGEERTEFLKVQKLHVRQQEEPLDPGSSYSFTSATEADIRQANVIYQERQPASIFAQ